MVVRCLAAGVDVMSLAICATLVEVLVQAIVGYLNLRPAVPIDRLAEVCAVLLISSSEFWAEGSLGKYLCGLRIRSITGNRAPIHRRIVRWSLKTTPLWIALVATLLEQFVTNPSLRWWRPFVGWMYTAASFAAGGLFVAFVPSYTKAKQSLYDMITRTAVYPAKPEHLEHHRGFEPVIGEPA
jgi:uncharacterized RDD family membrane protein YckC